MLQQTQVKVVIPYFTRWMKRFPTLSALAQSPISAIIKAWEGLGYYSRAHSLHKGSQYILDHHQGEIPPQRKSLEAIPGIGPYTAGAILSFAFQQRALAVDANILRLFSRYAAISDPIDRTRGKQRVNHVLEGFLPLENSPLVMEGLIELGALICNRNPQCLHCPLSASCVSFQKQQVAHFPVQSARPPRQSVTSDIAILSCDDQILLLSPQKKGRFAGLWQLPKKEEIEALPLKYVHHLPAVEHAFTRYLCLLKPTWWTTDYPQPILNCKWMPIQDLPALSFHAGDKSVLKYWMVHHLKAELRSHTLLQS
ncbi:MAG: A/G-specific adenine glycosylase [Chlamydiota bacterium]|nr:A/G-specific adenine glycosylase [Chlamydiota bacterium]